ncbi:hypothetical protein V6N13_055076 [Hibiscus sabdariffa]|uniref:Uncharacterized protein n=2 Tax=Hibiscus sabdariffa TaxID=183260 RepID=A0ABR2A1Q4_9ROSI
MHPTYGGSGARKLNQIEVVALDLDHSPGFEMNLVSQGNGKHAALRIVDKGGVSKGSDMARPGSVGFRVGKSGKDNVVKGSFRRANLDNRESDKVVVSTWIHSVSSQLDELAT